MQETSTIKILMCLRGYSVDMHNCDKRKKTLNNLKIEINKRLGMPIIIPLLSLICSFLLTSRKNKSVYNFLNKYIYLFIGFLALTISEIIVRYSGFSWYHTAVFYFLPLTLLPLFYLLLIKKFKYENLY